MGHQDGLRSAWVIVLKRGEAYADIVLMNQRIGTVLAWTALMNWSMAAHFGYLTTIGPSPLRMVTSDRSSPIITLPPLPKSDPPVVEAFPTSEKQAPAAAQVVPLPTLTSPPPVGSTQNSGAAILSLQNEKQEQIATPQMLLPFFKNHQTREGAVLVPVEFSPPVSLQPKPSSSATYTSPSAKP